MMLCFWSRADAQPVVQLSVPNDESQTYSQVLYVPVGGVFEIAVVANTLGNDISAASFAIPDLAHEYGVFILGTTYPTRRITHSAETSAGQYDMSFGGCLPACEALELVRVLYGDFAGSIGHVLLEVSGLGSDASGGGPSFYDCDGAVLSGAVGGAGVGRWECGVTPAPDGALVVNEICVLRSQPPSYLTPYGACDAPVSSGYESVGVLKATFR